MTDLPQNDRGIASLPVLHPPGTKLYDRRTPGLMLVVGRRALSWIWRYQLGGKRRDLTLGRHPVMTLALARIAAEKAAARVKVGENPGQAADAAREARRERRVADLSEEWLLDVERRLSPSTARSYRLHWSTDIAPVLGSLRPSEITKRLVREAQARAERRGSPGAAKRVGSTASAFIGWLIDKGHDDVAPLARLGTAAAARTRVLTDDEVRAFWLATGGEAAVTSAQAGAALRLMLLTGQRLQEVTGMRWSEIENGVWTLPEDEPGRSKRGFAHAVPLAPRAVALLDGLRGRHPEFVFAGRGTPGATRALVAGSTGWPRVQAAVPSLKDARMHDLRRTMRTGLSRLRIDPITAELAIGHAQRGLHKVYDRHARMDEKREALLAWEEHVLEIAGEAEGNVRRLAGRA